MRMLEALFEESFAVSGATKQKAITFFLKAAKFADIPLSPYLLTQLRNSGPRKKRLGRGKNAPLGPDEGTGTNPVISPVTPTTPGAETHSIRLVSGGTVTVSVSFNPFKLPPEDRAFVFALIDEVQDYERTHPLAMNEGEGEES